jgi:hypothetical protein
VEAFFNRGPQAFVPPPAPQASYAEGGDVEMDDMMGSAEEPMMDDSMGALSMMEPEEEESGYVQDGPGGGQDDQVLARLSPGEYVFDADVVSALGDGSNAEGARILDEFRRRLREHKRGASPSRIPPKARDPMSYLPKGAL